MNCRDLEKIMPELAEGELDARTARLAEEHIASCAACAAERAAYAEALGALAEPRPMLEVPAELGTLELPERRQGWAWLRPALGTAALAAIMAGIMLMPQREQEPITPKPPVRHGSPAPVKTAKTNDWTFHSKATAADTTVRRTKTDHRRDRTAAVAVVPQAGRAARPASRAIRAVIRGLSTPMEPTSGRSAGVTFDQDIPNHEEFAKARLWCLLTPDLPDKSVVVVACDIEDEPEAWSSGYQGQPETKAQSETAVVHIESTDTSTGRTTIYDYSRDEQGSEQVIEISSRT